MYLGNNRSTEFTILPEKGSEGYETMMDDMTGADNGWYYC